MSETAEGLATKLVAAWAPKRWRDVTVLVAVSGGADSVALARALHQVRESGSGRLVLAHFNHRLRGAESDTDQTFVEQIAEQLGLEIVTGSAPPLSPSPTLPLSTPAAAAEAPLRDLRYDFLKDAAAKTGARYVATAHTADDNVETILHNILRGTGLKGLAGIPRFRRLTEAATLVRPLLDISRAEVLDYLKSLGQSFCDDSTNASEDYTRNRIRLNLLPLLEREYNPRVREALLRLGRIAGETRDLVFQSAMQLLTEAAVLTADGVEIQVALLAAAHPALARSALVILWEGRGWSMADMSLEKWEQLHAMFHDKSAHAVQILPGSVRAERDGPVVRLTRAL